MSKRKQRLKENKDNGGYLKSFIKAVDQWYPIDNAYVQAYKQEVLQKVAQSLDTLAIARIIQAESKEEINGIVKFYAGEWVEHQEKSTLPSTADRMTLVKLLGPQNSNSVYRCDSLHDLYVMLRDNNITPGEFVGVRNEIFRPVQ